MAKLVQTIFCLMCFSLAGHAEQATQKKFTVFTEDFPPYNYLVNNTLTGSNVKIVEQVFAELGYTPDFKVLPWARSYEYVTNTPNTLIFSLARNKEREDKFKWVGSLTGVETCLFSLKTGRVDRIHSLAQAKKYQVVTQLNGHINMILARHGFKQGKNLSLSVSIGSSIKMLESGRADLIGLPKDVVYHYLRIQGRDPNKLIQQQHCFDSTALYLAFNKDTPDEIVEQFRQAMLRVKQ